MTQPVETLEVVAQLSLSGDTATPPVAMKHIKRGSISASWAGVTNFNGRFIVQGSLNPGSDVDWNHVAVESSACPVDAASDVQVWEITEVTMPFYRLYYESNGNTTGTAIIRWFGVNT